MDYIPTTDEERKEMLSAIGVSSVDALFADVPREVRFRGALNLPHPLAEGALLRHMQDLAAKNADLDSYTCFLGAGAYDHLIPSVVGHILSRSEFYTAYTPYQAEISQGVLQSIYEYQSLMCYLTGMEVANASVYDASTGVAESAIMACAATGRGKILVASSMHPEYRQVLKTYMKPQSVDVEEVPWHEGATDIEGLLERLDEETAAVIVQHPNFFGSLEDVERLAREVHARGALFVVCTDPISLGVLKAPGQYDADIVVGEGQSLGNPINFGGPYLGFLATTDKLLRRIPGRLVGATTDANGRRGFVLTLQTREQHIRRERASSNICTNQALNALAATVFLSVLGEKGLKETAHQSVQKSHYAYKRLMAVEGLRPAWRTPFYQEFVLVTDSNPGEVNERLLDYQIIGGLELGRFYKGLEYAWLFCVTEARTREEIDRLATVLEGLL